MARGGVLSRQTSCGTGRSARPSWIPFGSSNPEARAHRLRHTRIDGWDPINERGRWSTSSKSGRLGRSLSSISRVTDPAVLTRRSAMRKTSWPPRRPPRGAACRPHGRFATKASTAESRRGSLAISAITMGHSTREAATFRRAATAMAGSISDPPASVCALRRRASIGIVAAPHVGSQSRPPARSRASLTIAAATGGCVVPGGAACL